MSIFSESVRLLWSKNIPVNIFTIFKICCKCLCRILESVSIRKIKIYVKVNKVDIENPISSKFSSLLVDYPWWWVRSLKKSTPSKQDPYFLQIKPIHNFIWLFFLWCFLYLKKNVLSPWGHWYCGVIFFYCGLKGQRHEKSCSAEALGRWIRL